MNIYTFTSILFVGLLFAFTALAAMFYIRHWASRRVTNVTLAGEGRFLKRYVPPTLRPRYDEQRRQQTERHRLERRVVARWLYGGLGGSIMLVAGWAVYANFERLLPPIDLTPAEIAALHYQHHHWVKVPAAKLPHMTQQVALLRRRGVALIASAKDRTRTVDGRHLTLLGAEEWHHFLRQWKVPYRNCDWKDLHRCLGRRIGLVLPGQWDTAALDHALTHGADVIVYGPPFQVVKEGHNLVWHGMRFEPYERGTGKYLVLRGDQLLTLGFDAGQMIDFMPDFDGYRVISSNPQAIGIDTSRMVGGAMSTRLYATGVGKGRLVWLDFAPSAADHDPDISTQHLDALNAAVFRYLLGKPYSAWAMWPDGKRYAGMLSEDSEFEYVNARNVVDLARKNGFRLTWFMLSNLAQLHRGLTRDMASVGEVACHGDNHSSFSRDTLKVQTQRLARCIKVLTQVTGRRPIGFRAPKEDYDGDTINAVDSVSMHYFFAQSGGNRIVPELLRAADGKGSLVSLPRNVSDDYALWHTRRLGAVRSLAVANAQIRWSRMLGTFIPFDFHTQFMQDPKHLALVRHYAHEFQKSDCFFGTAREIARWWRLRVALGEGRTADAAERKEFHPMLLSVDKAGIMQRLDYTEGEKRLRAEGKETPPAVKHAVAETAAHVRKRPPAPSHAASSGTAKKQVPSRAKATAPAPTKPLEASRPVGSASTVPEVKPATKRVPQSAKPVTLSVAKKPSIPAQSAQSTPSTLASKSVEKSVSPPAKAVQSPANSSPATTRTTRSTASARTNRAVEKAVPPPAEAIASTTKRPQEPSRTARSAPTVPPSKLTEKQVPPSAKAALPSRRRPPVQSQTARSAQSVPTPKLAEKQVQPSAKAALPSGTRPPVSFRAARPAVQGPATTVAPPAGKPQQLLLQFSGKSWVEVHDATGHTLYNGFGRAGQRIAVSGVPPLDGTLGNPSGVTVGFPGRVVKLTSSVGGVVRFSAAVVPPAAKRTLLQLSMKGNSWVVVHDGSGARLAHTLAHAGQVMRFAGRPPYTVFLGRASAVAVRYGGVPVDVDGYRRGAVARFVIGVGQGANDEQQQTGKGEAVRHAHGGPVNRR